MTLKITKETLLPSGTAPLLVFTLDTMEYATFGRIYVVDVSHVNDHRHVLKYYKINVKIYE